MSKGESVLGHEDGSTAGRWLRILPAFFDLGAPGWSTSLRLLPQDGFLRLPQGADATSDEQP